MASVGRGGVPRRTVLVLAAGLGAAGALVTFLARDSVSERLRAAGGRALGNLKVAVAAQDHFAAGAGGAWATAACLSAPSSCGASIDERGALPAEIGNALLTGQSLHGYVYSLHLDPPSGPAQRFAFLAVPAVPGETGERAFCADDTGFECFRRDGRAPALAGGRCDPRDCARVE